MRENVCFRIHGDNIVECERGLDLVADAFSASVELVPSQPYYPTFRVARGRETLFSVELLPGHGRWGADVQRLLQAQGAPVARGDRCARGASCRGLRV